MPATFDAFIAYQARQRPTETAIITPTGTLSFGELDLMVGRFAAALAELELPPGTVCAVQFRNPVTHWLVLLALGRLAVCSACAKDTAASFRITDANEPGANEPGANTFVASDDWVLAVSKASPKPLAPPRPPPAAPGRILLSSGTTGTPKRTAVSWEVMDRSIRNNILVYGPFGTGPWLIETGVDTVIGFALALAACASGHAVLFRADLTLAAALTRFAPALLVMVPIQLQYELDHLPAGFARVDAMRIILAGGLPSPALAQAARRRLTTEIRLVYGSSECGAAAMADSRLLDRHPNAAGYAMPGVTTEIVDESGQAVPEGSPGEIRIRNDRLGQDVSSPASVSGFRDGWFHPGDLGRLLDDGLLLVEGRCDELMNIGGVKVLPAFVESALEGTQGVADLAVFAVPDDARVGSWYVAVVLEPGADRDAVLAEIRRRQPPLPLAHLLYVTKIPRNAMGKIERLKLAEIARTHDPGAVAPGSSLF